MSASPEQIAERLGSVVLVLAEKNHTIAAALVTDAASLIRAQSERERVLVEACTEALKLLEKGAPGWGVAKDILRAALKAAP